MDEEWANNKEHQKNRLEGIQQLLQKDKEKAPPQWYVNGQGQTMVVIPGPVEFMMGSPSTEENRNGRNRPGTLPNWGISGGRARWTPK